MPHHPGVIVTMKNNPAKTHVGNNKDILIPDNELTIPPLNSFESNEEIQYLVGGPFPANTKNNI